MAEESKIEKAERIYKKCPRCGGKVNHLTNSAGDVIVMCHKRTCHFAMIDEGQFLFMSTG
jgi:hypothetical protein